MLEELRLEPSSIDPEGQARRARDRRQSVGVLSFGVLTAVAVGLWMFGFGRSGEFAGKTEPARGVGGPLDPPMAAMPPGEAPGTGAERDREPDPDASPLPEDRDDAPSFVDESFDELFDDEPELFERADEERVFEAEDPRPPFEAEDPRPSFRDSNDPFRTELERSLTIYRNEESRLRDLMRAAIESALRNANTHQDEAKAQEYQRHLDAIDAGAAPPDLTATRQLWKELREKQALMQATFERAESAYRDSSDHEQAERVRRDREDFLEQIDSDEGRFLRSRGLTRRENYYVLLDDETKVLRAYKETSRRYDHAMEIVLIAREVARLDAVLHELHTEWHTLDSEMKLIDQAIRAGHIPQSRLPVVNARRAAIVARKTVLDRDWRIKRPLAASFARRSEIQSQLEQRLGELTRSVSALRPVFSTLRENYLEVQSPEVREALSSLSLKLGPSSESQNAETRLKRTATELRTLKIDLKLPREFPASISTL